MGALLIQDGRRRLRWSMLIIDLDPAEGHEHGGQRRGLVVSYEPLHASGLMIVCPVTAARSVARWPGEVALPRGEAGQTKDGLILCHQVRCVPIPRAGSMITAGRSVAVLRAPEIRRRVRDALATMLGLDIPGHGDGASGDESYQLAS